MLFRRLSAAHPAALLCALLVLLLLWFPEGSLQAAVKGVAIWWDVLFPALFPFLVIAEVMLGFGIVHFFGTLFDPLMRPLFGVPGIGGFVMAMGFASGYPVGARLTAQLWEQRLIERNEGERLVSFTTTSDPIFLIGAVSVGFFGDASLAPILAIAHYGSAIVVGLIMRWFGPVTASAAATGLRGSGFIVRRALQAMHRARLADGRPFGELLRQAVYQSLQLILVIGALVVFFSVTIDVVTEAHVMSLLHAAVEFVFHLFAIPAALSQAVVNGIFEVTLGAKAAGAAAGAVPLVSKAAIAVLVLSWGGLSVHAQIVSLLHHTNLRYGPFLAARVLHGLLGCALVFLLWDPLQTLRADTAAWLPYVEAGRASSVLSALLPTSAVVASVSLAVVLLLYPIYVLCGKMHDLLRKSR
jgi:sporulation integral membrane protein YlbJ